MIRSRAASILIALSALALLPGALAGQGRAGDGAVPPPSSRGAAVAEPGFRAGEIRIDGRIDEAAWEAAPLISDFVQSEPDEGLPGTHETRVRILFDEEAIYVAARMFDEPEEIRPILMRRDERGAFMDWFGVSLDPNLDRRTGYKFKVSAAGVQQDIYVSEDSREDSQWDAVWESAVHLDSLGWMVEIRIPLSQIRYDASDEPQTWGLNLHRRRTASAELSHFSLESRRIEGRVSQYGTLQNVRVPTASRRIEARPYVLSSLHDGPAEAGDPFFDGNAAAIRVGSDFRLGLGTAFTLDATVNPDFGQVEADPAVINLTAFESFFDERRPFFVEDAQVFDFNLSGGRNQLFYSRRIGRSPHGGDEPDDADFVDVPDAATILGAAKLTGRTSSGLSVGVLSAVTQAETGQAFFAADDRFVDFRAEPRTEYGVVTAGQDFNAGASQVKSIFTALHRGLPGDGTFADLPGQAYSGGVRFEHQWNERRWRLNGFLAGSRVEGDPEALIDVQRSSNHYFQRPDATRAEVDSTATSLMGAEWRLQLERQNGEHWSGSVWLAEVTKGFEINDLGFSNSRERIDGGLRWGYREIEPGSLFRDYSINFSSFYNFSHEALDDAGSWRSWREAYTGGGFNLGSRFTFLNYHGGNLNLSWDPDRYSRTATRGGPVMIEPGGYGLRMGVDTDRRRPLSVDMGFNYNWGSRDSGDRLSVDARLNLRSASRLQVQLRPEFSVQTDRAQYVTSTDALVYEPTYGRRYLFGELERKTLSLEARLDYTLSPTLSLQLYAQPLLSSGDYVRYKQLAAPDGFEFVAFTEGQATSAGGGVTCVGGAICRDAEGDQHIDFDGDGSPDYTFEDKDFNVRSLVGNAVLRWEYRPGSTVFLVWQRQQRGEVGLGDFDFGRDVDALWGVPADNRFIVKVNYWLGL